jgi:hypothetical protein
MGVMRIADRIPYFTPRHHQNCARALKTLKGLTPYEYICQCWHKEPDRFTINPYHHTWD